MNRIIKNQEFSDRLKADIPVLRFGDAEHFLPERRLDISPARRFRFPAVGNYKHLQSKQYRQNSCNFLFALNLHTFPVVRYCIKDHFQYINYKRY